MELRVLGAHNLASSTTQPPGLLVDGWLALDAGCIASALALSEQRQVRAVLLTHRHFDHIRDLPLLREALQEAEVLPTLYANADTHAALLKHYLQPFAGLPEMPVRLVEPGRSFQVGEYRVLPVEFPHGAPCAGYRLTSPQGRSLLYTGDTGPGAASSLAQAAANVLVIEVTFPNRLDERAREMGHLTPALLAVELKRVPRDRRPEQVVAVHLHPAMEPEIRRELSAVEAELGIPLILGQEGMALRL